jgi:calcineurin-like phosphoesterase family protein
MAKVWFIADLHFGHESIIEYEHRPFISVDEMDKELIDRWNNTVKPDDKVFVLGDVSFHNSAETIKLVKSLVGHKYLILGNHDRKKSVSYWKRAGFEEVYKYPIIYKEYYMLSHEPLYVNTNMPYANVHGHIHGQEMKSKQYVNVGVEHTGYAPISFESVQHIAKYGR